MKVTTVPRSITICDHFYLALNNVKWNIHFLGGKKCDHRLKKLGEKCSALLNADQDITIQRFKALVERKPEAGEVFACIEFFAQQDYSAAFNRSFLEREGGQVLLKTKWESFPGVEGSFFPNLNNYLNEIFSQYQFSQAEEDEYSSGFYDFHSEYFKKCWIAAGGVNAKVKTFLAYDKEYQYRDIFTGQIFDDHDVAKLLGFTFDEVG